MTGWLNPIALLGVLAVAGPIAAHLLRRHRADRLTFPSLRFIPSVRSSSVRFNKASDLALLLLRVAIVGFGAVALAQPYLLTTWGTGPVNARTSRAIVVDSHVAASRQAIEAALAESQNAASSVRTATALKAGLVDAVETLSALPPSRREIVVISDFRHGALTTADLARIPATIGLRFINVATSSVRAEFVGDVTLAAPGVPAYVQQIHLTSETTDVRLAPVAGRIDGLRVETSPDRAEMLLRSVALAGAPAPDPQEPIGVSFLPNVGTGGNSSRSLTRWMMRTVVRMRRDRVLVDAAHSHVRNLAGIDLPGVVIARDGKGAPVVTALRHESELVLALASAPEDYLSAATLQSALIARRGEPRWTDHEVTPIPASVLAGWTRAPGLVDVDAVRPGSPGHARWVWGIVFGLLILETAIGRGPTHARQHRYADAA